jgi:pyruvate formate lyase activating enzyme
LTDDENDINQIAMFAARLGNVMRVDVLPFHQMGRYKWKKLGLAYALDDVPAAPPWLVDRVCAQFRAVGLTAY